MLTNEQIDDIQVTVRELSTEFKRLKQFEEQMIAQQPFKVDERVQLSDVVLDIDYNRTYGWQASKHLLQPGNTGTIKAIRWNEFSNNRRGAWQIAWMPDVDWGEYTGATSRNVWIHHEDRRHAFYVPYRYVNKMSQKKRNPILPKPGATRYEVVDIPSPDAFSTSREEITHEEVLRRFGGKTHASV